MSRRHGSVSWGDRGVKSRWVPRPRGTDDEISTSVQAVGQMYGRAQTMRPGRVPAVGPAASAAIWIMPRVMRARHRFGNKNLAPTWSAPNGLADVPGPQTASRACWSKMPALRPALLVSQTLKQISGARLRHPSQSTTANVPRSIIVRDRGASPLTNEYRVPRRPVG